MEIFIFSSLQLILDEYPLKEIDSNELNEFLNLNDCEIHDDYDCDYYRQFSMVLTEKLLAPKSTSSNLRQLP